MKTTNIAISTASNSEVGTSMDTTVNIPLKSRNPSRYARLGSLLAGALFASLASACSDSPGVATAPVQNSGTARFETSSAATSFFLAPLGSSVGSPATFNATAVTRIEICVFVNNTCSGAPIQQFATIPTTGIAPLAVNTTAGRYEASWNLLNTSFLARKTYEIAVFNGTFKLQRVLVDVVRGRWALTRTDGTLAPLTAANELPIQFFAATVAIPQLTINEVESTGGTPGDWVELYNAGSTSVDLSGFVIKDNDDTHVYTIAPGTTLAAGAYLAADVETSFGLGAADAARLYTTQGALVDSYSWTTHAITTYGRCPSGTGAFTTTTSPTKGAANDCSAPTTLKINEVESSGGTPGDWIELVNIGLLPVNASGFVLKDNDDTHIFTIPAGTTIAAGAFVAFDVEVNYGLGSADAARLFTPTGTLLDSYSWTTHATTTYGRCPDGTGAFATTTASTKGAANSCGGTVPPPPTGPVTEAWPGTDDVITVDPTGAFASNLSGLIFERGLDGAADVLWGAQNGPGSIHRMLLVNGLWTRDVNNGWANGKATRYMDGNGEPDTEDVTFTTGSAAGMYIASERNNQANSVSRPSILRYDVTGTGTSLVATNEWVLTADLPVVAANSGLEGITWVPDATLVAQGFFDVAAGHLYNPAENPDNGGGLFFVGLEGNGVIYVYALNHTNNTFRRITSISTGFPSGVMALQFDRELNQLWATCDDTCGGLSDIFVIDTNAGSPTLGRLKLTHIFARPSSMPNINNEGFAFAPQSACVAGFKPVFWSDDNATGGHSIRKASIPCVRFP